MENAVAPAVNLRLLRMVTGRLDALRESPRRAGYHPSELHRMCPVFHFFVDQARMGLASDDPRPHFEFLMAVQDAKTRKFPGRLRLEFEVGDAIHQMVQFHLGVVGVLYGRWRCPACGARTRYGQMPRMRVDGVGGRPVVVGAPCRACKGRNRRSKHQWEYLEPRVTSEEWGVEGRCDGDLRVQRGDTLYECALEIKSINEYGWGEGQKKHWEEMAIEDGWTPPVGWVRPRPARPLPQEDHVMQASTYAWLMGREWLYFIYVNKNQVSRWREIMVPPNAEAVRIAQEKMSACNRGQEQKRPPVEARICPDPREVTARACPAAERCFGQAPPPNLWDADAEVFTDGG